MRQGDGTLLGEKCKCPLELTAAHVTNWANTLCAYVFVRPINGFRDGIMGSSSLRSNLQLICSVARSTLKVQQSKKIQTAVHNDGGFNLNDQRKTGDQGSIFILKLTREGLMSRMVMPRPPLQSCR